MYRSTADDKPRIAIANTIALQYAMINIVHALTMTFLSNGFHWLC